MKYLLKTSAPRKGVDLSELNEEQRSAVETDPGELLVIAGAGTGKTRTLTYRVAKLVERGCPPERILLCTFTNKAAREMVARAEAAAGVQLRGCAAGTFHHVAHRILRRFGEGLGLRPEFGILDPEDARSLLGKCLAELGLTTTSNKRLPEPKVLHDLFGLQSGSLQPLSRVLELRAPKLLEQLELLERLQRTYVEAKAKMQLCDFDDLLLHWHRLLTDPGLSSMAMALTTSFDHMLVDEYQDVNALQGAICDLMAAGHGSLTCVGDDAQSIYSFRGADFRQIHEFLRRHPGAKVIELVQNYRSTQRVLALANRCIAGNRAQHEKRLRSNRDEGPMPAVLPLRDAFQQAEFVAQRLLELHHDQSIKLSQMAVLYRSHSHSLELQVELGRRQIPFIVRSGLRFFEQAHIKDVVSYLRARDNPKDAIAWTRLLQLWPGVGASTAEILTRELCALGEIGASPGEVAALLSARSKAVPPRARESIAGLSALWATLAEITAPGEFLLAVLSRHYSSYAERSFGNASTRCDDIEHLASFASRWGQLRDFLGELALMAGIGAETVLPEESAQDPLVLSSIHQAKGLEWPVVFVIGLCDGKFPSPQSIRSAPDLEEERRLFYVASTRAADELYLCYPMFEEVARGPSKLLRPSRFLVELDHEPRVFERWSIEEQPLG